jgi:RecA/RadA recombinase
MSKFLDKLTKKLEVFDSSSLGDQDPLISEKVWVSTGSPSLDYNLKTFGFKPGLVEISGMSTSGKTTMGLTVAATYLQQYPEAICVLMLSEERINEDYVARLGVPVERVFKVKSKFLEDLIYKTQLHIDRIEETWKEEKLPGKPKIVLLFDSIGATISRSELETYKENVKAFNTSEEKGTAFKIKHARMASFAGAAMVHIKAIFSQLYEKDIIMICLNHLRDDLNNPMGGKTSSGGSWREYFCWLRLQLTVDKLATSKLKIDDEKWCQITKVKVIKNDFAGYQDTNLKLCIGYGFTLTDDDIEFAVEKKIIKKLSESKYSFADGKLVWSSPRTFLTLYRNQNKLLKVLHKLVTKARHKQLLDEKTNSNEAK